MTAILHKEKGCPVLNKLKLIYRCYRNRDIDDVSSDGGAWCQRTGVNMVEGGVLNAHDSCK